MAIAGFVKIVNRAGVTINFFQTGKLLTRRCTVTIGVFYPWSRRIIIIGSPRKNAKQTSNDISGEFLFARCPWGGVDLQTRSKSPRIAPADP